MGYTHSVTLDTEKCKGCTTCIKRCPTQAIRVRNGKAVINGSLCIDCGECIRVCPYKAKKASFDTFDEMDRNAFLIALPPPSLFGQFPTLEEPDQLVQALLDIGFDDVFEVAQAAEIATAFTLNYMKRGDIPSPLINSACPVIVRLIVMRYPSLCDHVFSLVQPMELAGRMAKQRALREHPELKPEQIRTVFISPCPAKISWVKSNQEDVKPVDYVLSMNEVYFHLIGVLKKTGKAGRVSEVGMTGLSWATTGGEASSAMYEDYLAADGIENVIRVLEEIENGNLDKVRFVELNACSGGCVGGVLTVENPYISRVKLRTMQRLLLGSSHRPRVTLPLGDDDLTSRETVEYRDVTRLSDDRVESIRMLAEVERLVAELPALDCGSCGSPTCRAFAEDIVRGEASEMDCIVRMREHLQKLLSEKGGAPQ